MQPPQQLIDDLFLDKVRAARAMSPQDKLLAGPRLFERSCRIMLDGLRDENPDADESRLQQLLHERLDRWLRLEGEDDR
ncbi:MAG TPA: hypothetical protein VG125_24735 [Pirellulales bacterium]|jgi:hypothetical protein|nr:hypothetical protein [Pirellulales bacterium]